jgi:3-oxoacyl-[acyl-carrier-protein] synthase-1
MGICLSPPGLICCAGNNRDKFFDAAIRGDQSGIRKVCLFGEKNFMAGRADAELPPAAAYTTDTRLFRIAGAALEQIRPDVEQAIAAYGADRVAVCAGSCDNGSEGSLLAHGAYFSAGTFPPGYELRFQEAGFLAEYIAGKFGIAGPALTVSTACASSAGALVKGAELIRSGLCDAVIAGGADIASEAALLGFDSLEAVSDTVSNPFSKNRKGITLGDGAAFFVMTEGKAPSGRAGGTAGVGDGIELLGYGESTDAFHMTAPLPDGSGAIRAMEAALADAGIGPSEVDYINLHGTGTRLNDRMEAEAVAGVFHDRMPPASSTKPVTGHTLGAAGALEAALCWMLLCHAGDGKDIGLPLHCWDGVCDEELPPLRFAGPGHRASPRICMSNSFAFGGCNVSLLLGRGNGRG